MDDSHFLEVQLHRGARRETVVDAVGDLDLAFVDRLRKEILPAVERGTVVLDVSRVTFFDSSGLRALLEANHEARVHGAVFRVAAPSPAVARVFELTGALTVLEVYPDVEAALRD
jgi:anti-sigma B factor antagonist